MNRKILRNIFDQKSWCRYNYCSQIQFKLYLLKLFLCVVLGKQRGHQYNKPTIPMLEFGQHVSGWDHSYNWTEVAVGEGLLTGWIYEVYPNGT